MPSANRIEKEHLVQDLNKSFGPMQAGVLLRCTGVTVEEITNLRKELRAKKVGLQVIKNTLAVRAVVNTPLEPLKDQFRGPTALAYTESDAVGMAKTLTEFAKKLDKRVEVCAGVLDGKLLSKEEVGELANVPSREVLLSRLVGSLQSPYAGLVYTLSGVLRKLVYALDAVRRQKEEQGK